VPYVCVDACGRINTNRPVKLNHMAGEEEEEEKEEGGQGTKPSKSMDGEFTMMEIAC